MKKLILPMFCLLMAVCLSGCGLMEDAFKAGLFFGIIVIAIIAALIWLLRMSVKLLVKKGILQID
ncbi:MAG: hypothetical protein JWP44_3711 [Mucilaginibacter sp.]|nr:hypothetical protein [Mucilaginibacter sp.]